MDCVERWTAGTFKQYVLGTMFYRYLSENFAEYVNEGENKVKRENGEPEDFDYALMADEDAYYRDKLLTFKDVA